MSIRHVARRVAISIAATAAAGSFAALAFSAPAGATGPSSGAIVPGSAQCSATCGAGIPFDSGQNINVVMPANSTFSATRNNNPGHQHRRVRRTQRRRAHEHPQPVTATTIVAGVLPATDGSFTAFNYTVYALPDAVSLGEGTSGPVCGSTSATECILYVGNNQNDFTQPHLWSQPFFVKANGNDAGANPGDGTPEVPMAILLPLSAMGLLGGAVLIRRRRQARAA